MITVFVRDCNISQRFYDSILSTLQLHQLTCPSCGHSACMSVHGYYYRTVRNASLLRIRIMRIRCSECGRTHAILLSSMVPYSQITLSDQVSIISSYRSHSDRSSVCDLNPAIDENNVKYVIRSFRKHWEQKLLSLRILLSPVDALVRRCFSDYSAQFMQIRIQINCLFRCST